VVEMGSLSESTPLYGEVVSCQDPQKVLILGAGRVAGPAVEYLGKNSRRELTVVGALEKETSRVAPRAKWAKQLVLDVGREHARVKSLIKEVDIVVSLLPAMMHADIARHCIDLGKNMVTSSYVSDEMRSLNDLAKSRGVTILNEGNVTAVTAAALLATTSSKS